MRRGIAIVLLCLMVIVLPGYGASPLEETAGYLRQTVPAPTVGSVGGEWTVLGLARAGIMDRAYRAAYLEQLGTTLKEQDGVLHSRKYTEYSRVTLALTALGEDAADPAWYCPVQRLTEYEKVITQGVTGVAYALLALDCGGYCQDSAVRQQYLDYLCAAQGENGSFSSGGQESVDATAMVLTALAPYQDRVGDTVKRGLSYLSAVQLPSGGFASGTENGESCAQVTVALCSLGIAVSDSRFVKGGNTVEDALLQFRLPSGGFCHVAGGGASLMTTEQAFYAMVALKRFRSGESGLYQMSDTASLPFSDLDGCVGQEEICALAEKGIVSGVSGDRFAPLSPMTRAEFACIAVRALGLSQAADLPFADVTPEHWCYPYLQAAYAAGIVSGVTPAEFLPEGRITREEAASMIFRCAGVLGVSTAVTDREQLLSREADGGAVSPWAAEAMAFCLQRGYVSDLRPQEPILRCEMAMMISRMLDDGSGAK